jgi:chromosome partitioning protein
MSNAAKVIAIYSLKGGVGKTSLAVNLAAELALVHRKKVLLWDLDAQSAASFILGLEPVQKHKAHAIFERDISPDKLIRKTALDGLDLLPADASLRQLDGLLVAIGKRRRLAKLIGLVAEQYDYVMLDCPPGLTETSEQIVRSADCIVVPLIPSALSRRALDQVVAFLKERYKGHSPLLPVFSMVDRRRLVHKAALEAEPDWPRIPMASAVEQMAERRLPLAVYAKSNPATDAIAVLTAAIVNKLRR